MCYHKHIFTHPGLGKLNLLGPFVCLGKINGGKEGVVTKEAFYKVKKSLIERFGTDAAILYAILENVSKFWNKRDKKGYFCVQLKYIVKETGWSESKVRRERDRLVEFGLLDYIPGKNQNMGGRYKLL